MFFGFMYTGRKSRRRKESIDTKEVTSATHLNCDYQYYLRLRHKFLKTTAFITQFYANLLRSFNNYTKDIEAFRINSIERYVFLRHI